MISKPPQGSKAGVGCRRRVSMGGLGGIWVSLESVGRRKSEEGKEELGGEGKSWTAEAHGGAE